MIADCGDGGPEDSRAAEPVRRASKGRVLLVEDEAMIRESTGMVLEEQGYEVRCAENGREALTRLYSEPLPDIIVLDLRMPVMNGWEFRTVQKTSPTLNLVPVLALSADGSAQAAAISAQGYLRKPVGARELLASIEQILLESKRQAAACLTETERLASLGRLAAGVGHEINNPLAFVMMNLRECLETLRPAARALEGPRVNGMGELASDDLESRVAGVIDMLEDCVVGAERIRGTVSNLQRLSACGPGGAQLPQGRVDVHQLIDQSISMAWEQMRHRARLVKCYGKIPLVLANGPALGQVFLNLLLNSAQAIHEGDADHNEIRVTTDLEVGASGPEVVVEIRDSGAGIARELLHQVFDPFFTTKPTGEGTGLGLSISRQTVTELGGRMTVHSDERIGTVLRVHLPVNRPDDSWATSGAGGGSLERSRSMGLASASDAPGIRGRILVIDDEPLVGRAIGNALKKVFEVTIVQGAGEAISRMEGGETFDVMLCDVSMPDISGSEFYDIVAERWPERTGRLVFMTGGAFTAESVEFVQRVAAPILSKPFAIETLWRLVRERMKAIEVRCDRSPGGTAPDPCG